MRKPEGNIRAVVYARIVAHRAERNEIAVQIEHCKEYIKASGYELAGSYIDEGASGTTMHRHAMDQLRHGARSGAFDIIVVHSISRIGRNAQDVRAFLDEMRACGVTVESVIDTEGSDLLCHL